MKSLLVVIISCFCSLSYSLEVDQIANNTSFKIPVALHESGQIYKALKALKKLKIPIEKEAYRYFLMSRYAYELSFYQKARNYIDKAIKLKIPLKDYSYFMKGLIEWEAREDFDSAEVNFKLALEQKPIRSLKLDIYYYLAKVNYAQNKYQESLFYFKKIQRPYRIDKRQPEIVWHLANISSIFEDRVNMCRWARNIYANFPFSKYVEHWDINLANNKIQKEEANCNPTYHEKKRRIKKLLWAGKDDKAKKDIQILKKSITEKNKSDVDSLVAEYLLHIGDVEEAVSLLIANYETKKNDFEYLMLLGYASFKASQYQTAVGSYHKAFKMQPRTRKGKTALFRAAFLSYQFQDYDGATRKFQQFISAFPKSTLSRDAKYHIAWMKYLRGKYRSAITGFESILAQRKKSRRGWRKYSTQRIQYWLGMSYLKLKEKEVARNIFEYLKNDSKKGYYSFASNSRLMQLGDKPLNTNPSESPAPRSLATLNISMSEALARAQLEVSNTSVVDSDDSVVTPEKTNEEINIEVSKEFWSKPKILTNIKRVEALIEMGQNNWAYRDLKFIESHIKDKKMYNDFVRNYQILKKFTRASYLTEIKLFPQFTKEELGSNTKLWKSAYPLAFEKSVLKYSKAFTVPKNFVWSIMKAESRYNPIVESPVGAKGLMQLMPYTAVKVAKLLGSTNKESLYLHEPETNIKLGTRYLSRLLNKFKNQIPLAAAAYNAGPHRVTSWLSKFGNLELDEFIEHIPFVETRNYVKRVTRFYGSYNMAYNNNTEPLDFLAKNIPVKTSGPIPTKEDWN